MTFDLPYTVLPFTNESGSTSFRVTGSWKGERIRKNFAERVLADAFCNDKNVEALRGASAPVQFRVVQTRLEEADVRTAEAALDRIAGRWSLKEVLDRGLATLENDVPSQLVEPLATEWLQLVEHEVSDRWLKDLRHRVEYFLDAHPGLTTDRFNRSVVRKWLDGLPLAQQSKANMRNGLHRFCGWLVERGHLKENPASGIRITRRKSGAQTADRPLPTVFSPAQCEALLKAASLGSNRRVLGWVSTCLFTGMRPESEAPRATWAEINFATSEWSVMGRKRGAKPRVIKLQPAALEWLKVVKADAMEKPALFFRAARRKAVIDANAWLAANRPEEKPIVWDEDITRHTFASYRSPQIQVHELAGEMGNSPGTIYAHYRHPKPAADVAAFWALRP